MGHRKDGFVKVYLILYNVFQLVGFGYVLAAISARYARLGYASVADTYVHVGSVVKFVQLTQYMEVLHPILGLTKGEPLTPFAQISGRVLALHLNIDAVPRIQAQPVVPYLLAVWSAVEIVRYSYYITQLFNKDIGVVTWIRYSAWVLLYPLGLGGEFIVIFKNIPYFEETKRLSITLPNDWNFSFHMSFLSKIYIGLILPMAGIYLLKHMFILRRKKLRPNIVNEKCK